MGLVVVDPGAFATIQDLGRPGYRGFGVPPGGSFDRGAADLANALLGNPADAAVLELTLRGGVYEAKATLALALAGAAMPAAIEGGAGPTRPLDVPASFTLRPGERLALGFATRGLRTYLAVRGGWRTPSVLGSRSAEAPLRAGTMLPCEPGSVATRHLGPSDHDEPSPDAPFRVVDGPDAGLVDPSSWRIGRAYRVLPASDRVGLRLDGPAWDVPADPDRVSTPVAPGAVQVAGGRPLILGAACGTMGGYPHVAHVVAADLDRLGQLRPGDRVRFERVSLDAARLLDRERRGRLRARRLRLAAAASDN